MDRVRPLKFEDPATGGTQEDEFPTSLDPNEDAVDAHGLVLQDDSSDDEQVTVTRDGSGNMVLTDVQNPAGKTLTSLASGGFDINDIVWDDAGGIVYDDSDVAVSKA